MFELVSCFMFLDVPVIFNHSSWSDGISGVCGPPGDLFVAGVLLVRWSVPGALVFVGVGVEVVMGAVCLGVS